MPRPLLPPPVMALRALRFSQRWGQRELSRVLGREFKIGEIENGRHLNFSREKLTEIALAAGTPEEGVELALGLAELLHAHHSAEAEPRPNTLPAEVRRNIERLVLENSRRLREELTARALAERHAFERERAAALGASWESLTIEERKLALRLASPDEACWSWAFVEWLGNESERAASSAPQRALDLANLALIAAQGGTLGERSRRECESFALGFRANAWRVQGQLKKGAGDFAAAYRLLGTREVENLPATERATPLDLLRLLDLEASLCRGQRRLPDARTLLDRALSVIEASSPEDPRLGRILLKQSFVLEQLGEHSGAVAILERAVPLAEGGRDARLRFGVQFNLAVNWIELGEVGAAEALLPIVRGLAIALREEIDLCRVNWLEARLLAARGETERAIAMLDDVTRRFESRGLGYDLALALLELSALLVARGAARAARERLAVALPVFRAQEVEPEELASLSLFLEALEQEAATAALARGAVLAWKRWGRV